MKKLFLSFLLCTFVFSQINAQTTIIGKVTDAETSNPLIGVNIVLKGTQKGTTTDIQGLFQIEVPKLPAVLVFSYTGFKSDTIEVLNKTSLNVKLEAGVLTDCWFGPPIVIQAAPINLTLPAPFMKITKSHLQRDDEVAITSALNRVSGVFMHSGALNTNRITMRGIGNRSPFSTTKIRAYLDDIPLTSGDGETTIEDIDLSLLDEVKVWKGPTASIYGAGLGGMIHLKTRARFEKTFLSSKMTVGSYGLIRNATNFNFTNKDRKLNLKLNYNNTHSDGYRANNEYDREAFSVLGKLTSDSNNETTLFANLTKLKAFIPSSLNRDDYENEPQKAAFTWGRVMGFEDYNKGLIGLSHKSYLGRLGDIGLQNKTSVFTNFRNSYESRPFNILDESSQSYGVRTSFDLRAPGTYSNPFPLISVGIEAFREEYRWQTFETNDGVLGGQLSNNQEERIYQNIFAQFHKKANDKLTILGGVNLNHTLYKYEDRFVADSIDLSGEYTFDWVLSPRLGLSYQFDYKAAVFATVSHGFSPPSLSETLTPDGNINPDIQPEKGWNFELGSRGHFNYNLIYEVTFYQMLIRDLLVAKRISPDQFTGVNAGKTTHRGAEIYVGGHFNLGQNTVQPFLTYTYSDYEFTDFIDDDNDYSGNELTGTPPHILNVGVDYSHFIGLYGNVNFNYTDAFPMRDDNSVYSDAYGVFNLKIGYKHTNLFDRQLQMDIFAGIRNVLNEKYASMILINAGSFGGNAPRYYYPGLPRNFYGGVSLKWFL